MLLLFEIFCFDLLHKLLTSCKLRVLDRNKKKRKSRHIYVLLKLLEKRDLLLFRKFKFFDKHLM